MLDEIRGRDLKFWEVYKLSTVIFVKRFSLFAKVALLVGLPATLILTLWTPNLVDGPMWMTYLNSFLYTAIDVVSLMPVILALLIIEDIIANKKSERFFELFSRGLKKWPQMIFTYILYTILLQLGVTFFLVLGIVAMVYLAFVYPATVFDGLYSFQALSESFRLVKGRWFKTLGYLIPLMLLNVATVYVLAYYREFFQFGFRYLYVILGAFIHHLLIYFVYTTIAILYLHRQYHIK